MSQDSSVKNAADPKQVKEAAAKDKRRDDRDRLDLKNVLSSVSGRRFVYRQLRLCGMFRTSFDNSGSVTAFNEGRRNVGLRLMDEVKTADPEMFLAMFRESTEEEDA